ncbi:MAG: 50S ribosomal protein L6 [Gemmatimonadota bacterium]|nr:50S ribosomal protein L6 [Gemmatimonadota bacterium]MDH4347727.1 50S ribosomal protein L6 [Gemmatimonadota bacterium]
MSRIGRMPVTVPKGVSLSLDGQTLSVKGPKGELSRTFHPDMKIAVDGGTVVVTRPTEESRHKALHGLTRSLVNNMVEGVAKGYVKVLEIQGVGYKAEKKGAGLQLSLGFSHPVVYPTPAGITFTVDNNTILKIEGPDKELVGQVAAEIRSLRKPEPYKGKGVRYQGEAVRRKAGKTGAK